MSQINLHKIKIELMNAMNRISKTITSLKISLNTIECLPKDFTKDFVDKNIYEIENIETGIAELEHCGESIFKFCKQ